MRHVFVICNHLLKVQQRVCRRDGTKTGRENEWPSGRHKRQEQHGRRTTFQTTFQREGTRTPNFRRGKKNTLRHNSEESPREEMDRASWFIQNIQMHEPGLEHWLAYSVIAQLFCLNFANKSPWFFFQISPHFTHSCTPSHYLSQSLSPFHVSPVTFGTLVPVVHVESLASVMSIFLSPFPSLWRSRKVKR